MQGYLAFMRRHYPEGEAADPFNTMAYTAAQVMVHVLERCGNNLTRENVLRVATSLNRLELPLLLPGMSLSTSPADYHPFSQLQLARFDGKRWVRFGDLVSARHCARARTSSSSITNAAVLEACDFSAIGHMVDVAGGTRAALCHVLQGYRGTHGTVFDLDHVAPRAHALIASQGLTHRCVVVAGSLFDTLPGGADAYFLKHILHDWGDGDCKRSLATCRAAMRGSARLLICERIVPEGAGPSSSKWIDLHRLLTTHHGRERTMSEYRELLSRSGFALSRVVATRTPWSLIEATPV